MFIGGTCLGHDHFLSHPFFKGAFKKQMFSRTRKQPLAQLAAAIPWRGGRPAPDDRGALGPALLQAGGARLEAFAGSSEGWRRGVGEGVGARGVPRFAVWVAPLFWLVFKGTRQRKHLFDLVFQRTQTGTPKPVWGW